jgi:protein subunit release factor A
MKPFLRHQLERYAQRLEELDFLLSREDIMADMNQFLKLSREHADVSVVAKRYVRYQERSHDLQAANAMLETRLEDADMKAMAEEEIQSATQEMDELEVELQRMLLPKDPDDARPAYLEIRAGTGGDESALFAGDLLRMYTKFCERKGWRTEIMSESPSELGGYKEVVIRMEGDNVFGTMRFESGGHRVQRVPATETQGRIHTSACTVAVLAEPDEAQQNGFGGSHHAHSNGHRSRVPRRSKPTPQQSQSVASFVGAYSRKRTQRACGQRCRLAQRPHWQWRPLRSHSHLQLSSGPPDRSPHQPHLVQAELHHGR